MENRNAARHGRPGGGNSDLQQSEYTRELEIGSSPIRLCPLAEMEPPAPRTEVVEGLLAAGEVMLLTGAPKAGKSLVAARLAASISLGEGFAGRCVQRGPVVYLALERGAVQRRRIAAAGADLALVFMPAGRARPKVNLANVEQMEGLASVLQSIHPKLVVIDTAAKAMPDLDENSARDAGRVMAGLAVLQDRLPDAAIVLIHHLAKGGTGARGSGAILAGADMELRIERERSKAASADLVATTTGANDVPDDQQIAFAFEDEAGEIVATHCDLPRRGARPTARDTARDRRNERAKELASADASALLDAVDADTFTLQAALDVEKQLPENRDIKPDSVRKKIARQIDRMVADGLVVKTAEGFARTGAGQAVGFALPDNRTAGRTGAGQAVGQAQNGTGRTAGQAVDGPYIGARPPVRLSEIVSGGDDDLPF